MVKLTEELLQLLRKEEPALFTIAIMNAKLLKDVEFGEIKVTEYIKNGKIYRIETYPVISKMIDQS